MRDDRVNESVVTLLWSLWTELGVPGVVRNHGLTAIDPEPLIVATPHLGARDPRLLDEVFGWCAEHAAWISSSRLQGLCDDASAPKREAFSAFSASLRAKGVRWPEPSVGTPYPTPSRIRRNDVPAARPALVRLRIRSLVGVGTRADVLAALLAREAQWRSASDLADLGYTKRNVARVLADLEKGGLVASRRDGNSLRYRLMHPEALRGLLGDTDVAWPEWTLIFDIVERIDDIAALATRNAATRRVEAHKIREGLAGSLRAAWLELPPVTQGVDPAWENLAAWAERWVVDLANGRSDALGAPWARAVVAADGASVWLDPRAAADPHVTSRLREPHVYALGVTAKAAAAEADGRTRVDLAFDPPLSDVAARNKVRHLLGPLTIAFTTTE